MSSDEGVSFSTTEENWELLFLDANPPVTNLASLAVGDIDGDGHVELVTGGHGGLLWYRPDTFERGVIHEGDFHVGAVLEDVDGDGLPEIVAGTGKQASIVWFKPAAGGPGPDPAGWTVHEIDPAATGGAHDVLFADIDGDGERELVAIACNPGPGVCVYKRDEDVTRPWKKHEVDSGFFAEGLSVGDFDGDGRLEILNGPYHYAPPEGGALAGRWRRTVYAPGFREMCRTAVVDVTGDGRPDVVICESEFLEGRLWWFENRLGKDASDPWVGHEIERGVYYGHTLGARRDEDAGEAQVFLAEMAEGGWSAPRNRDARVLELVSRDSGRTWHRRVISRGSGTHEAVMVDVDSDGELEVVGKQWRRPKVQIWKRREKPSPLARFRHRLLDRDKPATATDILAADVDGDGLLDVVCGSWWYKNPTWERREIPGVFQVHFACDIDGDGRTEFVATKKRADAKNWYAGLSSELVWVKPVNPAADEWERHEIGTGSGDWPHGSLVAPVLPGGKKALFVCYHKGSKDGPFPEIFELPDDPKKSPWPKRVLAEIGVREELKAADLFGDGRMHVVAGEWLLENLGDGGFRAHPMAEGFEAARVAFADVNGNGLPDVVAGEEVLDFKNKVTPLSLLAWFENPGEITGEPWKMHVIDKVRCAHSVAAADLDGDGQAEVVCGEHDPFYPYRTRCRLMIYKKADPKGTAWHRYVIDDRFEHHDGTKVFEVAPGRLGIASHGWKDTRYVHLWEAY